MTERCLWEYISILPACLSNQEQERCDSEAMKLQLFWEEHHPWPQSLCSTFSSCAAALHGLLAPIILQAPGSHTTWVRPGKNRMSLFNHILLHGSFTVLSNIKKGSAPGNTILYLHYLSCRISPKTFSLV